MSSFKYRSDITGLRAIAVLPVLFFHSKVPFFSGGFLGVDVFFVISGFLITGIIINEIQGNRFSLFGFYDRRIRRIIPVLLFVTICTTILSFFFMLPYDLKNYGESLVAVILSANNILLYLTSGYWSLSSEFKPLYHTWSLGVEEQYYLIMPILIVMVLRISKLNTKVLAAILFLLICLSFFLSLLHDNKEFVFLMLFTRAWELLVGSMLAIVIKNLNVRKNSYLPIIGICFLVLSYVNPYIVSDNLALVMAMPVLGTTLIILFSDQKCFVGKLLSSRPLFFIGLISYSIYLWHQPILSFLRLASEYEPSWTKQILYALASIPLAYFSWRYIENPFRSKKIFNSKKIYIIVCSFALTILALGLILYKSYGFSFLWPKLSYNSSNPQAYVDNPRRFKQSSFNTEDNNVLVLGSSYARDFINMMSENQLLRKYNIIYYEGSCNLEGKIDSLKLLDFLNSSDYVVLAGYWGATSDEGADWVQSCYGELSRNTHGKVFVLGTKNFGWNNNFVKWLPRESLYKHRVRPLKTVSSFNKKARNTIRSHYIDLIGLLSDTQGKLPIFTDKNTFITYDTSHLTPDGARYVGGLLFKHHPEILGLRSN